MQYFTYFTEIEEHFQRARQSGMFLLSPLDWALIETWRESGVPLEAALKGIDRAFEKWHKRQTRSRRVNSVAYCSQEVLAAAKEMVEGSAAREAGGAEETGFEAAEIAAYFRKNAGRIRERAEAVKEQLRAVYSKTAESLEKLAAEAESQGLEDLEAVEQRLTVLEEMLYAAAMQDADEEQMLAARQEMDRQLAPYRRKMNAEQIALLERQFLQRKRLETADLPRLSLFYLHGG